jgi:hypothetical protein
LFFLQRSRGIQMNVTEHQVWKAAIKDPNFAEGIPLGSRQREVMKPFIRKSAFVLDDQLGKRVTLQTITDAKRLFYVYCLENNLGAAMDDGLEIRAGTVNELLEHEIYTLVLALKDMVDFPEKYSAIEAEKMLSDKVGMNEDNQKKWHDGTLTIGWLLQTQPSVVLRNI